jgi:hypothetical protein
MSEVSLWPLGEQAIRDIERIAARHGIGTGPARELYWAFGKEDQWIRCALAVGLEQAHRLRSEVSLHLDSRRLAERVRELQESNRQPSLAE